MLVSKKHKKLKYYVSYPDGYREGEKYPVLLYTHGSGGRGGRLSAIKRDEVYSINPCLNDFIIVMPHCECDSWFDVFGELIDFCKFIYDSPFTDKSRFYATGVSMGGYACYQLMMSLPDLFTAALVCCGGGMYWNGARLKNIWVRAFHGKDDKVVYPEESAKMVASIGERAELILYDNTAHDCWTATYGNQENYKWLLSKRK